MKCSLNRFSYMRDNLTLIKLYSNYVNTNINLMSLIFKSIILCSSFSFLIFKFSFLIVVCIITQLMFNADYSNLIYAKTKHFYSINVNEISWNFQTQKNMLSNFQVASKVLSTNLRLKNMKTICVLIKLLLLLFLCQDI